MGFLSANALWASAALLLFALYTIIIKSLHRRSLMKKYGCKEPPHYPHWDPFLGYDLYRDMVRASVRGNVTKPARERFQRLGRTYKAKSMGWNVIHTMDPQNIQTICALSLKNFGAAPLRKASGLVPLLGHGVLSLDGPEWAQARASTKPIFARSSIADFSTFGKHFERALALVPRDGSTVDLQPIFKRLVCRIWSSDQLHVDERVADTRST
jgi:cytochrome P450